MLRRSHLTLLGLILITGVLSAPTVAQQTRTDADVAARIRQEANSRSQILRTVHFFSDVYGPRLTGSPNVKAAGEWAIKQMAEWGFVNGHLEPFDFKHPG